VKKPVAQNKRPKSVMQKAWATRRKKAARGRLAEKMAAQTLNADQRREAIYKVKNDIARRLLMVHDKQGGWQEVKDLDRVSHKEDSKLELQVDQLMKPQSREQYRMALEGYLNAARYDGVAQGLADAKRRNQEAMLCGFVALYQREEGQRVKHAPMVLSRVMGQAILDLLKSLGYTPDGKI
jgi:hypothetical protein